MPVTQATLKRLFAKCGNLCALSDCQLPLVVDDKILVEICHIRARSKKGPRYDSTLTALERDEAKNLILLCPTCHKRIDKNEADFPVDKLLGIKKSHEMRMLRMGNLEVTNEDGVRAQKLLDKIATLSKAAKVKAIAKREAVAVAIGGDNNAPISINNITRGGGAGTKGYPANSIGGDANLTNYIDYLFDLYGKYWLPVEPNVGKSWGKLGKNVKDKFRLRKRTRNHLGAERFDELVAYLTEKLANSPLGKKHIRNGSKLCRTFQEFRSGKM